MVRTNFQTALRPAVRADASTVTLFTAVYDHDIAGWLYSFYYHKAFRFSNLLQMLHAFESMLDGLACVQRFTEPRRFLDGPQACGYKACLEEGDSFMAQHENETEKATFLIHVKFRRNATWQGTVQWIDQEKTQSFRSTLELIKLIDEAMEGDAVIPCWENAADE